MIANVTGKPFRFLRTHSFHFRLCLDSRLALSRGIKIVDADVNPTDYSRTTPEQILELTLGAESLQAGSVIDLHDGSETEDHAELSSAPALFPLACIFRPKLIL